MSTLIIMLVALAGFVPASGGVFSNTFIPDRPINVPQDFISYAMGTDVRSTSLRPDRPINVPQDFISYAMGTSSNSFPKNPLIQSMIGTNNIQSIDKNYFENHTPGTPENLDPSSLGNPNWNGASGEIDQINITYSAEHANLIPLDSNIISSFWTDGVSCGSGTGFITKKGKVPKPQSVDSLPTGCQSLYNEALAYDNNQDWQMAYDTGKKLIEHCADSSLSFGNVISGFSFMQQAADGLGNYGALRSNFYNWLKSVLYLNTTEPEYFCQCVYVMSGEVPIPNHIYPDTGYNYVLAVINWLIQNTNCDSAGLRGLYASTRADQIHIWQNDPSGYTLDTTLPPLDSIEPGLKELLEKHFLYASVSETPQPSIISNATANPNPTGEGTVISFGISQEAYVKIELFDILGHEVGSAGFESLFEPGNKSVPLSLAGLPSGTYFARILTAYGEAQSVKLVKE